MSSGASGPATKWPKMYPQPSPQYPAPRGVVSSVWRRQAACFPAPDPDLFFPVSQHDPLLEDALAICARCDVAAECLAEASLNGYEGVWGGQLLLR